MMKKKNNRERDDIVQKGMELMMSNLSFFASTTG